MDERGGFAEDAIGVVVLVEGGGGWAVGEDLAELRGGIAGLEFPGTFEHAFVEVVHDEGSFGEEPTWAGLVVDADRDLVPETLFEQAWCDFVAVVTGKAVLVIGREGTSTADADSIDEHLVSIGERSDGECDGFGEKIAVVFGEEGIVRFQPSAVPAVAL